MNLLKKWAERPVEAEVLLVRTEEEGEASDDQYDDDLHSPFPTELDLRHLSADQQIQVKAP